jgi:hypothetical protein
MGTQELVEPLKGGPDSSSQVQYGTGCPTIYFSGNSHFPLFAACLCKNGFANYLPTLGLAGQDCTRG